MSKMRTSIKKNSILEGLVRILYGATVCFILLVVLFTRLDKKMGSAFDFAGKTFVTDVVPNGVLLLVGVCLVAAVCYGYDVYCKRRISPQRTGNSKQVDPATDSRKQELQIKKQELQIKKQECQIQKQLWIMTAVLLIVEITFAYNIYLYVGTDTAVLRNGAMSFVSGKWDAFFNQGYLQMCPNNIHNYFLYILFYQVGQWLSVDGYVLLMGLAVLLSNLSVLFTALCMYRMTHSDKAAKICFLLSAVFFGLSPWISSAYSDTLSILFPILTLYIYLVMREKKLHPFLKCLAVMTLPMVTYSIKPLNVIVLLAIVGCEIVYVGRETFTQRKILSCVGACVLLLVMVVGIRTGIYHFVKYELDESKALSINYYLVLGTDYETYGGWSQEGVDYIYNLDTPREKNQAAYDLIVQRLQTIGMGGYVRHFMNKTHMFYNNGLFGWELIPGLAETIPQEKNPTLSPLLRNLVYPAKNYGLGNYCGKYGAYFISYAVYSQFLWMNCLGACGLFAVFAKRRNRGDCVLMITIVGVFLFTMLFETSARLLFSYLPIFVLTGCLGWYRLREKQL